MKKTHTYTLTLKQKNKKRIEINYPILIVLVLTGAILIGGLFYAIQKTNPQIIDVNLEIQPAYDENKNNTIVIFPGLENATAYYITNSSRYDVPVTINYERLNYINESGMQLTPQFYELRILINFPALPSDEAAGFIELYFNCTVTGILTINNFPSNSSDPNSPFKSAQFLNDCIKIELNYLGHKDLRFTAPITQTQIKREDLDV